MESAGRFPAIRVLIDLLCVTLAIVTDQFGFGVLGGLVWVHAFLSRYQDKAVDWSLGYLCCVLLFTIRPPFAAFDVVSGQMTQRATRLASRLLDQLHYLHLATSDSIELSGHSFLIQQICDVFFSMPAFMCFACVFLCLMRRRWAHAIPSLLACSIIALLMLATRLCVTVVVWQEYGTDASVGVERLILSAAVFVFGLLSFISFDVLLSAFTEPVPLMATSTINPFAMMWNRLFLALSRNESEEPDDAGTQDVKSVLEEAPSVFAMLGPWAGDFLFSWFVTRSRRRLFIGLPSIVLGVAGTLLWTNRDTLEQINGRYEAALTEAIDQNRDADLELAVRRLQRSRVNTFAVRFRRAQTLISVGKNDDAITILKALTPPDGQGYVPARIWLVKQSERSDALIPL